MTILLRKYSNKSIVFYVNILTILINRKKIIDMTIFERTKSLARKKGLSLAALNDKAGLGKNTIYTWKRVKPGTEALDKVAKVLNVSTDYLLGNNEDNRQRTADLDDDDVIFTYQGKPLSEEDKALIKRLMNGKD